MIRGVRGATTVGQDNPEEIMNKTKILFETILKKNHILADDIASVFISTTPDISSAFPAKALRELNGFSYVPVMCMKEMDVPNSLERCIRMMVHVNTQRGQMEIKHVYLEGATHLRSDMTETS